jgi:hypothetical protein
MSVPSLLGSRLRLLRKAWQLLVVSHVALLPDHAVVQWQHRYEGYDLVVWGQRERIEQGDLEGGCCSLVCIMLMELVAATSCSSTPVRSACDHEL